MSTDLWVEEVNIIVWPLTQDSHSTAVSNISSKANGPNVTKFLVGPPWAEETKIYTNPQGHMTNMATMPIYGKNL